MDDEGKGIAWIGNLYRKFEAMYLDENTVMGEDALNYMESRLQKVGSNVRQFCSDFIEELLLSSSVDIVEGEDSSPGEKLNNFPYISSEEPVKTRPFDSSLEEADFTLKEKQEVNAEGTEIHGRNHEMQLESEPGLLLLVPDEANWEFQETNEELLVNSGDAGDDLSCDKEYSGHVTLVEHDESKVVDIGLSPSNDSAISDDEETKNNAAEREIKTVISSDKMMSFTSYKKKFLVESLLKKLRLLRTQKQGQHTISERDNVDEEVLSQEKGIRSSSSTLGEKTDTRDDKFDESEWEII